MSMEPWPALRTKRSRLAHLGLAGLKRRYLVQRTKAKSAQPMGRPQWPLLAFSTASTVSIWIVLGTRDSMGSVAKWAGSWLISKGQAIVANLRCLDVTCDDGVKEGRGRRSR